MSMPEVERLIADVKADKDLQDKVRAVHPSNERVVEWANAHGYDITLDELDAYIREQKGELTDEELNRVVGGKGLSYDWTITNPQGVSHTYDPRQLAAIGHDMFIAHPVAAQIDQGWAGYKDTFAADKQSIQDASPEALLDPAQSHGATVEQNGPATLVTLNDNLAISVNHEAGGPGLVQTTVFLRDGDQILHDSQLGPGGGPEGYWTKFVFPDNSYFMVQDGEKSFYSQPDSEWIMSGGPGEIEVSGTQGTSTFEVARASAVTATVTTDQGTTVSDLGLKEVEQDWAAHTGAPVAWNEPGAEIAVQSGAGWSLDHTDASGLQTTFTSASGTEYVLPHVPTSDWTITNSQGDYRTFTPEQIHPGEVDWLVAHPKIDTWPIEKPTALADWNADKAAAVTHAQDPAVQASESMIDSYEATGEAFGGDLPHGGWLSPAYRNGIEVQAIDTAQGRDFFLGHGEVQVLGTEPSDGSQQFVLQHDVDATVNDPSWSIDTRSGLEIDLGRPYGPDTEDTVSKGGATLVHEVNDSQDQWIIRSNWVKGYAVETGEQWTVKKGDSPVTPQSVEPDWSEVARDHFVQAHPSATTIASDITVENNWYMTDSSGQVIGKYNSNRLRQDAENVETAHPQAVQEIKTWTADKGTYETAKQMWSGSGVDPQGLPEGTVSGSKGDVSYTFTPGTPGQSGYDLVIKGPDTYFHTETMEYEGTPDRWVGYDSDKTGKENNVDVVYSNGQVENLQVNDSYYVRPEGSNRGQVGGSRGDWLFSPVDGLDNQPLETQVVLPDGEDVTLTRNTMIQGPRGGFVLRDEVPDADPIMTVQLRDGTAIQWQKSDETHAEDGIPLYEANLESFDVAGPGGQWLQWLPEQGFSWYDGHTVEDLNPVESGAVAPPSTSPGGILDGDGFASTGASWSFQLPRATVSVTGEYGFWCAKDSVPYETDLVSVTFNDGTTVYHRPYESGVYSDGSPNDPNPHGIAYWTDGKLQQVGEHNLRYYGQVTVETPSGGTLITVPEWESTDGPIQLMYEGPGGNVLTYNWWPAEGDPPYSLDGIPIEKGQDATIMGPYGRISVEWGVSSQDLPEGSSQSGTNSGLAVFGVHRDVQVVETEQDGHNAWAINNDKVICPYNYAAKVQSGQVALPAGVTTDVWVFSQVDVSTNAVEAVDVASTVQVVGEVEVFLFAFAFVT